MAPVEEVMRMAALVLLLIVVKQWALARSLVEEAEAVKVGAALEAGLQGPTVLVVPAASPGAGDGGEESLLEVYLLGKGLRALKSDVGNRNSLAVHHAKEALRCGASDTKAIVTTSPHPHFLDFLASRKIFQISAIDMDTMGSFTEIFAHHDTWVLVLEEKGAEGLLVESKATALSWEVYENVRDIVKLVENDRF